MEPLKYKMDVAFPRDRVWDAWTTAAGLASWLCERAQVEPAVGGAFELTFGARAGGRLVPPTFGCRVLSLSRPRLLQFSFRLPDSVAGATEAEGPTLTDVKVELLPTPDGTRLEVTHAGCGDGPGWEKARASLDGLWYEALERLRVVLRSGKDR